jgi:hypothetical protein
MVHEFGSNPFVFRQCVKMLWYIPNEFPNPQPIHSDVSVFMDRFLISACFAGRWMTWMVQYPWQTSVHSCTSKTPQHFISAVSSPMASFNITRFL